MCSTACAPQGLVTILRCNTVQNALITQHFYKSSSRRTIIGYDVNVKIAKCRMSSEILQLWLSGATAVM